MKYKANDTGETVRFDQLDRLYDITDDTIILVYNEEHGTCKLSINELLTFLDYHYQPREEVNSNNFIDAVNKVFNTKK